MNIFGAIAVLVLLSACGANAAGLPAHFSAPAKDRAFVQAGDAVSPSGEGWAKLCFDVPAGEAGDKESASQLAEVKGGVEACYTYVELREHVVHALWGLVGVLQIQPAGRSFLIAFLPGGSALPPDPGYILLDGTERIQLTYFAIHPADLPHSPCDLMGCYAKTPMTPALLDRTKSAKAISFAAWGQEPSFPLPCCGFKAAFDNAPVPAEAQDETQRIIQEFIRQRFAAFMQ
ncbi:MAG: hypothetical protein ACLPX9_10575 [Rhodomicrobium sp.]